MHQGVRSLWVTEISSAKHWKADPAFDQLIEGRFSKLHDSAVRGELFEWRVELAGRLAEIIVLDQFSRNLYRNSALAFAAAPMALALAQEAIALKVDQALAPAQRVFLYTPFMASSLYSPFVCGKR